MKSAAIEQQLSALRCDRFRITLMPRVAGLGARNFGNLSSAKRAEKGIQEKFWSISGVISQIDKLQIENMKGCDVYITPISDDLHHLLIDDATPESLTALVAAGYKPALVQRSSANNLQAILMVDKTASAGEQSIANSFFVDLNRRFGDRNITGVVHPFRLAGFANKKAGKDNFFCRIVEASGKLCGRANDELRLCRAKMDATSAVDQKPAERVLTAQALTEPIEFDSSNLEALAAFEMHWQNESRRIIERGLPVDNSKIDFRVAKNLRAMGFSDGEIVAAIIAGSPELIARHRDTAYYACGVVSRSR